MARLVPYIHFPGTAREALTFYHGVFGGALELHTRAEFGSTDGPADAIAHGILAGPVDLFAADASTATRPLVMSGIMFSLLGTADPRTLESWFTALADDGTVIDPLQERPWGAHDGTLTDRYGITWLIGYED
ncbi:MAG: VOC family protein [Microbacterium sp.]|jgi:PhnB protein|uniref:VOC family protein n=1 Tax=unclassified Microbacterium TaxID=2609290 RepID=UPI000DB2C7C9|nr:VOC family protein [Microbacterium sp.]PZU39342.1 MAG: VOC family protein [Microbacterium sp.]